MAHYNHWRELSTDIARQAIRRLRDTGTEIRSQGPLLAHINDNADDWARLWKALYEKWKEHELEIYVFIAVPVAIIILVYAILQRRRRRQNRNQLEG